MYIRISGYVLILKILSMLFMSYRWAAGEKLAADAPCCWSNIIRSQECSISEMTSICDQPNRGIKATVETW